jgi:asparagine synthase (glutamine-hydrolysing)
MCGIAGIFDPGHEEIPRLDKRLAAMNELQRHRGPDGSGKWTHSAKHVGLAHRRLSIIDRETGGQPMRDHWGNWVTYNGEIYNYIELRKELGEENFVTTSDTEVILHSYRKWGADCVNRFVGMFAFALWDEERQELFCARDRFGIKPFYYTELNNTFLFASEIKALLPFIDIETDLEGFKDYLTFQFVLNGHTMFKNVWELPPANTLIVTQQGIKVNTYWQLRYNHDFNHTEAYFREELLALLEESIELHLRSDVPVGAYVSGGLDSGAVAALAARNRGSDEMAGFTGKFAAFGPDYDESNYAEMITRENNFPLHQVDISVNDFIDNIEKVVYHLDNPVAGPGSFPQYMVSNLASNHRKVVLGGQGGDESFGGYTRYLIAYFEQCIKGAIDGTMNSGNFIVTYESIIPNLTALQRYKPLLKEFWKEGLFEPMDRRYFRLIDRSSTLENEIRWSALEDYNPFESFKAVFNSNNVKKESYFDLMTNFDFKTLLPALLHVEDRMSMAHGLEARVPLLYHPLIELAATMPSNIKFKDGTMKYIFKQVIRPLLPGAVLERKDKMGFPTPLAEWVNGEAKDYVADIFLSEKARSRDLVDNKRVSASLGKEKKYGRKIWGLLNLELWHRQFHDRAADFKSVFENA